MMPTTHTKGDWWRTRPICSSVMSLMNYKAPNHTLIALYGMLKISPNPSLLDPSTLKQKPLTTTCIWGKLCTVQIKDNVAFVYIQLEHVICKSSEQFVVVIVCVNSSVSILLLESHGVWAWSIKMLKFTQTGYSTFLDQLAHYTLQVNMNKSNVVVEWYHNCQYNL